MVAVHALVPAAEVWRLLPELEAAGASSILIVPVERMARMSIVAEIKERGHRRGARVGARARRRRAGAGRSRTASLPREALLALADRVRRWHEAQRPADVTLEVEPGVDARAALGAARHRRHLRPAQPRLDARHVRRARAGRRRAAHRRLHAARRRRPDRAPRRSCSGSTRCGRSAARRRSAGSPTSSASTRSSGPATPYVNDAKLEVSRDVAIDLPGGPSEVVVARRGGDPRIVELELAAQARARARRGLHASSRRSRRRRRSRPSTSCCSATPRRCAGEVRNAGAVFVGPWLAGRRGRLRDRRQPRPADERLGALGRRARARDVPQAGHDPAPDRGGARAGPADGRGARGGRGDARARGGGARDESARAGVRAVHVGAADATRSRASPGIDPSQVVRFDQNTPPLPLPSTRPGAIAGALARGQRLPARRLPRAAPRDRRLRRRRAGERRARRRRRRPDPARARARSPGPGDTIAIPQAPTYPLYRIAAQLAGAEVGDDDPVLTFACRPNNPTGDARRRCPTRGRSSSTRRTSSTAARPRCR